MNTATLDRPAGPPPGTSPAGANAARKPNDRPEPAPPRTASVEASPAADARRADLVLIVDDVPDNLSVLHDALDESGYTVLVATNGADAIERADSARPDVVLLDAVMPGLDGFEVARRLKAMPTTAHIPIVFMTGLTETEHVVAAFAAGGSDYVTKPIRPREVMARIEAHLQTARAQRQARNALDAFGHATMAVRERDGRCAWQTALARSLMLDFFGSTQPAPARDPEEVNDPVLAQLPPEVFAWMARESIRRRAGAEPAPLTVSRGARRLSFVLHAVDPAALGDGQWLVVMRESNDSSLIDALVHAFRLTQREAEVLYWVVKGKTNRDIGDILGTSPRTVHKHLEHVFEKLGVETRTAAASMAMTRVAALATPASVTTPVIGLR
jgi:DNA-binding NarL/FixJ family response regulator